MVSGTRAVAPSTASTTSISLPGSSIAAPPPSTAAAPPATKTAPVTGITGPVASSPLAITTKPTQATPPAYTTVGNTRVLTGTVPIEINLEDFSPSAVTIGTGTTVHWVVPAHENHVLISENPAVSGFFISYYTGTVDTLFTIPGVYRFHLEEYEVAICTVTVVAV